MLIYAAIRLESWKLPSAQQAPALMDAMTHDTSLLVTGMVAGSLCSVIGGYVAARIARREPLLNGALSAWLCLPLGVYAMFAGSDALPLWVHLLLLPMSPVLGAVGGLVWLRFNPSAVGDQTTAATAS
jgi:hypothetical protein